MLRKWIDEFNCKNGLTCITAFGLMLIHNVSFAVNSTEPVFNQNEPLLPEKLVELVLQRNADLQAADSELQAANERANYIGTLADPMFKYAIAPNTVGQNNLDTGHIFSLSQRLPWFGKRRLQRESARLEADASQEKVEMSRLELTEAAQLGFSRWYFVHAALRINQHDQSLLEEFKKIAEIKYSAGKASRRDVLRAEMETLLLRQYTIRLQREQKEILSSLNRLLNRDTDAFIPEPGDFPLPKNKITHINDITKQSLQRHPDIRNLEQRIAAEQVKVQLADKSGYPDFNVNAMYNGVMDPVEKRFQVGVSMNIPFGRKIHAQKSEARARLKTLQWQKESLLHTLKSKLQQAVDRLEESRQLLQLYRNDLLPLAQENMSTTQREYETGRSDFLTLINAEQKLSKVQLDKESILTDYYQRLVNLNRLMGRTQINGIDEPFMGTERVSFHPPGELR